MRLQFDRRTPSSGNGSGTAPSPVRSIADPAKARIAQGALAAFLPIEVDVKMITTAGKEPNKSDESNESMRQRMTVIAGEQKQGASLPVGQVNPKKLLELPIV